MNFSVLYPGRLGNQLNLLYNIYTKYDSIDKIYAPYFNEYSQFFNINNLCNEEYYRNNIDSFIEIKWENLIQPLNYHDSKYQDLELKNEYKQIIKEIVQQFGNVNLISVHIRQKDYREWNNGIYYFSYERYMHDCFNKMKEWGLYDNYKIIVFSDEEQNTDLGVINSRKLTNGNPVLDLFLMSECNYFISTYSTFSIISMNLSKSKNKFKNNFIIE